MGQVALVALSSFPYADRKLSEGDTFEASEKDANILKLLKRAVDAPTRGRYDAKVMQPVPDGSQDAASLSDEVKPKRQYRRRDLTPEP